MTSAITTTNIDVTYPIPGQDNDTQGFRNNWGAIKTALDTAAGEISDLQIIQSALISLTSSKPESPTGKEGDVIGQIYATTGSVYICTQSYNPLSTTTNIWAQISANWPWV